MLRTVFMGTPRFAATVLEKLVQAHLTPMAVVCQPARNTGRGLRLAESEVEQVAKRLALPVLAAENVNAPEIVEHLGAFKPDLFLVVAFGQLLKDQTLAIPKIFSLNIHGSLLPKYRGAAPIQRAVLEGQSITGVSIQKMVRKMDAGDILLQRSTAIGLRETAAELFERLAVLGGECLVEAVQQVESGKYVFVPQMETQATYAPKIAKEEGAIDWNRPAERILRQIRGLQPWPIAETRLGGDRLKIFEALDVPPHGEGAPGTIACDGKTQLVVACGHSTAVSLTRIQLENRKKMETRDFLMAYRGKFPFAKMN